MMGPPGSGKSTQAQILGQRFNVPAISTGVLFREIAQQDTDLGKKIKAIIDSGGLIDDETTYEAVDKYLGILKNGFVLDGYPRTLSQAKRELVLIDKVIYIKISDELATERILKRKERADDTAEVVAHRLVVYHESTELILDYYRKQGKLLEIDGNGTIEEVEKLIWEGLGNE